jgi:uncharacterized repeat protein (TIGR01451 family)
MGNPPIKPALEGIAPPMVVRWEDEHGNQVGPDSAHRVNQTLVYDSTPYDTVVRRLDAATFNGPNETQSVGIQIVGLSLKTVRPITVTYGAGGSMLWEVLVELDENVAQETRFMTLKSETVTDTEASGPVENVNLKVGYKVTFLPLGEGHEITLYSGDLPGELPAAEFENPQDGFFSFPVPLVAEKTDILAVDHDEDGLAEPGDIIRYQVGIANYSGVDATGVQFADVLDGTTLVPDTLQVTPIPFNDSYDVIGNVGISVPPGSGVLANDFDPDGDLPLTAVDLDDSMTQGTVTLNPDGSFDYTPPVGFDGTDSFVYTARDATGLDSIAEGIVTLNVSDVIWFIDNSAPPAGNGTLSSPFDSVAAFNMSTDTGFWDNIYLAETGTNYAVGIDLMNDQTLVGAGATGAATLGEVLEIAVPPGTPMLPPVGGTKPIIESFDAGIDLAHSNTVRGVELGDTPPIRPAFPVSTSARPRSAM